MEQKQKIQLNTEQQEKAARRVMAMLSLSDLPRRKVVQKICSKITVQDEYTGEVRERPRIYKRTSQGSELVKKLVSSENFPVEKDGNFLTRTDLQHQEGKQDELY